MRTLAKTLLATALLLPALLPAHAVDPPLVSDGRTPTLTPQGTLTVPPPGMPMLIVEEDPANVHAAPADDRWGVPDLAALGSGPGAPREPPGDNLTSLTCSTYSVGWHETNSAGNGLHGGHVGIIPRNMPPSTQHYCGGQGMGYTDAVSFGANSWLQAGLAIFPGETKARWFCQGSDFGSLHTHYGTANTYGNGAIVYTWFSRDSSGVWRTYRYDTGPWAIQLPCAITRGASGALQVFGEIQSASSTSAPMGPWQTFDLRIQGTNGIWGVPTQIQAFYPWSTPCPPYGAGTVLAGVITAGSGEACTTGTSPYPN